MITPTPVTPSPAPAVTTTPYHATVSEADLASLIAAIAAAGVITLPVGKTLADVVSLNLSVRPTVASGVAAVINAQIK